jgi:Uma2 family endonuclease
MNIAVQPPHMSVPAFLQWVKEQEGRFELKDGAVRMMTGATRGHARLCGRFLVVLEGRLPASAFTVMASDIAVRVGDDIRYPDIVVEASGGDDRGLVSEQPFVIVEVLSPSSIQIDMREKAEEYLSLSSLHAYVVASQDEPRVWVWRRGEDGVFPKEPEMIAGADKALAVPALGLSVSLGEVYAVLSPRQPTLP